MTDFEDQARAALAAKSDTQRQLAAAAQCPPSRHAAFGLLMWTIIASQAFAQPVKFALLGLMFVAMILIVRWDRRRTGMFINGYRRGKTRIVTFAILAVELGLLALASHRVIGFHDRTAPLLLGVVGAALGWIGSVIWQRVFVTELAG